MAVDLDCGRVGIRTAKYCVKKEIVVMPGEEILGFLLQEVSSKSVVI